MLDGTEEVTKIIGFSYRRRLIYFTNVFDDNRIFLFRCLHNNNGNF